MDKSPTFSTVQRNRLRDFVSSLLEEPDPTTRLTLPRYDRAEDVEDPEVGELIYLTGVGERPEGVWRFTDTGWQSGGQTNRLGYSVAQREVSNGGKFIILRTTLGADEDFFVWSSQITNVQGNQKGLKMQVTNENSGDVIYERSATEGDEIVSGEPLAKDTSDVDRQIRIRVQNSSNQTKNATASINTSIEKSR